VRKKDLLAEKLAAGTAIASMSAAWWPSHSCSLYAYIKVMRDVEARKSLGDEAIRFAKEWDAHVKGSQGYMLQHVAYELAMIDAAAIGDSAAIDRVQAALETNLQEQAIWYAHRLPYFPRVTFEDLMRSHSHLFLDAVIHKMNENRRRLIACERKREHNAVSLGALMTEWI